MGSENKISKSLEEKKIIDNDKPKPPLNPYLSYTNEIKTKFRTENPKHPMISHIDIKEKWKSLTEKAKKVYTDIYNKQRSAYLKLKEKYKIETTKFNKKEKKNKKKNKSVNKNKSEENNNYS